MAKGIIRASVLDTFINLSTKRLDGEFGDISSGTLSEGNIAFRSAVLEYAISTFNVNRTAAATHYNHAFKKVKAEAPELVVGLGRSDDKKGGRKLGGKNTPRDGSMVEQVELTYTVVRAKDGAVVANGVTKTVAEELITKAAKGKKAKLVIQ